MDKEFEYMETVIALSDLSHVMSQASKDIAIIKEHGQPMFYIGIFSENRTRKVKGISLSISEMRRLMKAIKENEAEITEKISMVDKFKKDYLQQSHSGSLSEIIKENVIW